jgi:carbamoyltransferase
LNCVANGKLLKKGSFREIWIQPASGDAGGALGAALATHCEYLGQSRLPSKGKDLMRGAYLGPDFSEAEIITALQSKNANFVAMADDQLLPIVAELLSQGHVVGWFSGSMEFGPRSLGGRSILADPRFPDMQSKLNLKVKNRESFRPFAPVVLQETNPRFYQLLSFFEAQTGCPVLINTSFNVRGEPIVQSPEDAFDCFMSTGIDCLAIGNFLLMKEDQILAESTDLPARQFVLD